MMNRLSIAYSMAPLVLLVACSSGPPADQAADMVYTNAYGQAPAYVILREEVGRVNWLNENGDVRSKYQRIHADLGEYRNDEYLL